MRIPHGLRAALAGQGAAPPAPTSDPNFENVSLLLHGDGTNGAQNNTFTDSSANNFTITRTGNTTQGTFSPFSPTGWSGYFDGTGDSLSIADNAALQMGSGDFTVEFWINFSSITGYQTPFNKGYTSAGALLFQTGNGNGRMVIYVGGSAVITETGTASTGTWIHYALVRNGSTLTLYRDGSSSGSATNSTNINSNSTLYIGSSVTSSPDYPINGYISNLRLVKGTAVYTSNFTPPTSPLTAITNTSLLTLQDNRFKDNSTNNFTITRNGDTKIEAFSPFNPTAAYSASTHGGSGYFDGTGDWLTAASNTAFDVSASAYTFEGWFYWTGGAANTTILFGLLGSANSTGYAAAFISSGTLYWQQVGSGTNETTASFTPVVGQWYHIAVGWNGSNSLAIWINGTRVATNTVTPTSAGQAGVNVGGRSSGNALTGYISNFRLVKGTDVYGVGNSTITVPTAPLTAITNTSLLLNFTNGGIIDNASKNVLETVGNAQISTSVKKYGTGSMYFDGAGDYLYKPSDSMTSLSGDFTVEAWIYRAVSGVLHPIINVGDYLNSAGIIFYVTSGNALGIYTNNALAMSGGTISATTWTHVAMVRNGTGSGNIKLYVDGVSVGTPTTNTATFSGRLQAGADFYNSTITNYFNGYIDDLRITKGVARYTANFTPPTQAFPDL